MALWQAGRGYLLTNDFFCIDWEVEFMARILGISCYYHDSAACLVVDGRIVAASQEERYTRVKHDARFPTHAVEYCLREGGIGRADLDAVVFHEKPLLKFDRLISSWLSTAPCGFSAFLAAFPNWVKEKLYIPRQIRRGLAGAYKRGVLFSGHHESHAASAFFPSPFPEAAILTLDGVGEWETSTVGFGSGNRVEILQSQRFPDSLGLLYSAFTYFLGFRVNSGEYKVMGLAPYGKPRYERTIRDHLVSINGDGSFQLNQKYFDYIGGLRMTSRRFGELIGSPPRSPESPLTQREMDLAASLQRVTEDIVLKMAATARSLTGSSRLCLAGGVALNSVANGKLRRSGIFEEVWIQPASGDAGGALGAALVAHHHFFGGERKACAGDSMRGALLGDQYSAVEIEDFLCEEKAAFEVKTEEEMNQAIADALDEGMVIGWFQGRMEYGPRALGNRSILGDPRKPGMQRRLNVKIKYRESFRPFAPAVLAEDCHRVFALTGDSPYMLFVDQVLGCVRSEDVVPPGESDEDRIRRLLQSTHPELPAITHVDGSARIQTVDAERNPRFYSLLRAWKEKTGCPVLVNTSFNIRGEPIVRTPADAWRCFVGTGMDILVLGNHLVRKRDNPGLITEVADYRRSYPLD